MTFVDNKYTYVQNLTPNSKTVNLQFIVLEIGSTRKTLDGVDIKTVKVADQSGSINLCLWNEKDDTFQPGDIFRMRNGFCSVYKGCLVLKCSKNGELVKSGEFLMAYSETPNVSDFKSEYLALSSAQTGGGRQSPNYIPAAESSSSRADSGTKTTTGPPPAKRRPPVPAPPAERRSGGGGFGGETTNDNGVIAAVQRSDVSSNRRQMTKASHLEPSHSKHLHKSAGATQRSIATAAPFARGGSGAPSSAVVQSKDTNGADLRPKVADAHGLKRGWRYLTPSLSVSDNGTAAHSTFQSQKAVDSVGFDRNIVYANGGGTSCRQPSGVTRVGGGQPKTSYAQPKTLYAQTHAFS